MAKSHLIIHKFSSLHVLFKLAEYTRTPYLHLLQITSLKDKYILYFKWNFFVLINMNIKLFLKIVPESNSVMFFLCQMITNKNKFWLFLTE